MHENHPSPSPSCSYTKNAFDTAAPTRAGLAVQAAWTGSTYRRLAVHAKRWPRILNPVAPPLPLFHQGVCHSLLTFSPHPHSPNICLFERGLHSPSSVAPADPDPVTPQPPSNIFSHIALLSISSTVPLPTPDPRPPSSAVTLHSNRQLRHPPVDFSTFVRLLGSSTASLGRRSLPANLDPTSDRRACPPPPSSNTLFTPPRWLLSISSMLNTAYVVGPCMYS